MRSPVTTFIKTSIFYLLLTIGMAVIVLPVYWMFMASFMTLADVFDTPVNLYPPIWQPQNYITIFAEFEIGLYFRNSIVVTGSIVILNLLFCSSVGYGLAKFDFPGKNLVFMFIMATIMIPFAVILIPLYLIVRTFDWIDTFQGLIIPFAMSPVGIFLMRQFIISVPDDYMDAARIDGASELSIFWRIVLPLSRPAVITLAIITFVTNWDQFLWPLIITTTKYYRTLPIGLASFMQQFTNDWHLLMTSAVVAVLPVMLLFLVMQRQFLEGMAGLSGIK
ncbi:carbohydrate ABC transporter permease [Chloroflexi bacterium TSY]|nr:carbohydrate ABC transporter permease [Chloroflexi bacterium TSY]